MANKGTKKRLVVDTATYISSTKTHFSSHGARSGAVVLTLYLEGNRRTFFRLHFLENETPNLLAGDFSGCVTDLKTGFGENLNRPGAIVAIIKKALSEGWAPNLAGKPTEIRDGMSWIKTIAFPKEVGNAKC